MHEPDIYRLTNTVGYDLQVPINLPVGFSFQYARITSDDTIILLYAQLMSPDNIPVAEITISQHPELLTQPVGASAFIEQTMIDVIQENISKVIGYQHHT